MQKKITCVINNIHNKVIISLIKVLDQGCTMYDTSGKDKRGVWLGMNVVESQITILDRQCTDWSIKGSHQADGESSVSNRTRKYKQDLSEDAAVSCLHNHKVMSFAVIKARATINDIYVLIEVNH